MTRSAAPARSVRALLLCLTVLALVLLAPATRSEAHAFLASSNPPDGAVVEHAPRELRLGFSESVELSATRVEVVDGDGHRQPVRHLRLAGGSATDTEEPTSVLVGLPALPPNTYRVSWETLSSDDLHRTSGVIVFGVQQAVRAAGLHEPTPLLDESALRWLVFLGLSTALGGSLVSRLSRRHAPASPHLGRRADLLALAGAAASAVIGAGLLLLQGRRAGVSVLLAGQYGERWALREAGLVLLALVSWARARAGSGAGGPRTALPAGIGAAAAACAALGSALLGHSATGTQLSPTRVGADALHVLAAGTWVGGVIVAAAVVVPAVRAGGGREAEARAVLRGFGVPAAACVGTVLVTGLYLASSVVGSVDAALLTIYGRVLLAKVALVGVAASLGLLSSAALHPRVAARLPGPLRRTAGHRLSRTVPAEALAGVVLLGLAAVLTSAQPAREPQLVSIAEPPAVPVVDRQVADLQESVSVRPNRPGRNVVLVGVFDTRRPAPGPVTSVQVRVVGPDGRRRPAVAAEPLADGRWSAATALDEPGRVRLAVSVTRAGLPDAVAGYGWTVLPPPGRTDPPVVSTAPIGAALRTTATGLAALLLAVAGAVAARRRRARPGEPEPAAPAELLAPVG